MTVDNKVTAEQLKLAMDGNSVDWFLQNLVHIVNTSEMEFGVTLVLGGTLVSGRLISGKKYFDEFGKEFSATWPGDSREVIHQAFANQGDLYKQPEDTLPPPQFLHLADARCFFLDGQLPNNKGVLWRGKINAVSGFSFGQLTAQL